MSRFHIKSVFLAVAIGLLCVSCSTGNPLLQSSACQADAKGSGPPDLAVLEELLQMELARLGVDPAKASSMAPGQKATVFDLSAILVEADGEDPAGVALDWTYRSPGDYDLNSEVNISDLSSLVTYWNGIVAYDDPGLHAGITYWPSGNPLDNGGTADEDPPAIGSGAENWRAAQADGDSNGEISISDITPIAQSFNTVIQLYNIYMREVGTEEFSAIGQAQVSKSSNPRLPLRLSYFYEFTPKQMA